MIDLTVTRDQLEQILSALGLVLDYENDLEEAARLVLLIEVVEKKLARQL